MATLSDVQHYKICTERKTWVRSPLSLLETFPQSSDTSDLDHVDDDDVDDDDDDNDKDYDDDNKNNVDNNHSNTTTNRTKQQRRRR